MAEEEKERKEEVQQQEEENKDILDKEIDSWKEHFGYALREENRILFNKMLYLNVYQMKNNTTMQSILKERNTLPNRCLWP
jgi:hypothetical protein